MTDTGRQNGTAQWVVMEVTERSVLFLRRDGEEELVLPRRLLNGEVKEGDVYQLVAELSALGCLGRTNLSFLGRKSYHKNSA